VAVACLSRPAILDSFGVYRFVVAVAAVLSIVMLGGAATAGTPGAWTRVTDQSLRNIDDLGLVRTKDGVLHVVWHLSQGSTESIRHATVAKNGKVVGATTAVPGLRGASSPDLEVTPTGDLLAFFSTVTPSPGGVRMARSTNGGSTWSSPDRVSADTQGGAPGATVTPTGNPVFAWAAGAASWYHEGTDPAQADTPLGPSPKCCYYDFETAAEGNRVLVAYHSNVSDGPGIFVRQVHPTLGSPQLAPQALTNKNFVQPDHRVPLVAREGGGIFLAYCSGYPRCARVLLWRVGGAARVVARGSDIEDVGLARGPGGRLWVFWHEGDAKTLYAVRTNAAGSRIGAIVTLKPPRGTTSVWDVYGEGSLGPLDLFASVTTPGSLASWHTQVLPGLSVGCTAKRTRVTCSVHDAGAPVGGATVKIGSRAVKTGATGKANTTLKPGSYKVTAGKAGYTAGATRVRVR
jgi:hypothetical protein